MTQLYRMFATILVLGIATAAFAQGRPGMRNYDLKTEITVKGTVQSVQEQAGRHGWKGTHLVLKTDSGTLPVHVGPSSYISNKQFSFAEGDQVDWRNGNITGSRDHKRWKDTGVTRCSGHTAMDWRTSPELSKQAHNEGASNGAPYVFLVVTTRL